MDVQQQDMGGHLLMASWDKLPPNLHGEGKLGAGVHQPCLVLVFNQHLVVLRGLVLVLVRFLLPSHSCCFLPPAALTPGAQLLHPVPPGLCAPALLSLVFLPPVPTHFPPISLSAPVAFPSQLSASLLLFTPVPAQPVCTYYRH